MSTVTKAAGPNGIAVGGGWHFALLPRLGLGLVHGRQETRVRSLSQERAEAPQREQKQDEADREQAEKLRPDGLKPRAPKQD